MSAGLLRGLRVVDLSGITAGGRTTQLLADFGADVVKVEGPRRPDPFRHWSGVTGEAGAGDLGSPPFRVVGRNKRGIAVDLKDVRGIGAIRPLVEEADVVVENFRRGVMERLGLGFEVLSEWNPHVVLLSLSSQGDRGPQRDFVSFGGTLEALGGLMSVTGYSPDEPLWTTSKVNYPDQAVSLLAPALALHAVLRSRATGRGVHVDLSQRETVVSLIAEELAWSTLAGSVPEPAGNQVPGELTLCARAKGHDEWVVATMATEDDWQRFARAIGRADLLDDSRFTDVTRNCLDVGELNAAFEAWLAPLDKSEAMRLLQGQGVAAAEVLRAYELPDRESDRGESLHVRVPRAGGGSELQVSWPFVVDGLDQPSVTRRAPHVGEHSAEVLVEHGLSSAQVEELIRAEVVARAPQRSTASQCDKESVG